MACSGFVGKNKTQDFGFSLFCRKTHNAGEAKEEFNIKGDPSLTAEEGELNMPIQTKKAKFCAGLCPPVTSLEDLKSCFTP